MAEKLPPRVKGKGNCSSFPLLDFDVFIGRHQQLGYNDLSKWKQLIDVRRTFMGVSLSYGEVAEGNAG